MTKEFSPQRLDVKAFAQAGGHLSGHDSLLKYERLAQEAKGLHPDLIVDWQADGELRSTHGIGGQIWLRLVARAAFPMTCQRCLGPVDVPLEVEREFRFVADEATAEALDDESDEDLLALSREFNLRELIEDELLMALPLVPRHDECPAPVPMESTDEDFEEASAQKPNPFAALAALRKDKSED
ncbi:YceD family protein [Acidovorax sp. SUPP3334]|uniref:YceD family protein n=1 Tax=Acidovorax sp. SUPP3334 TaxID=2920881 RepID=UPI0023DE4D07|nr:YceD family protein [Acidovorax sp. SUPP3334]GKT22252.1 YceD family protein [Acidovorax sp. SUPP3334]